MIAAGVLLALVVAAALAWRLRPETEADRLRPDDLLFVTLASVPGGVAAGRLGYVLVHLDYYRPIPARSSIPRRAAFSWASPSLGAALTGVLAARLLTEPAGRGSTWRRSRPCWRSASARSPWRSGAAARARRRRSPWATSYAGPGALGVARPGAGVAPGAALRGGRHRARRHRAGGSRDGRRVRPARRPRLRSSRSRSGPRRGRPSRTTWRDARVAGPLRAEQLISLVVIAGVLSSGAATCRRPSLPPRAAAAGGATSQWPDPETRPAVLRGRGSGRREYRVGLATTPSGRAIGRRRDRN